MANQPTKYKKFVATAATATLVASAIVPVASAASFTDVNPETNSHAAAIDALVEQGIIQGYQDGTFKPNQTLTRGHVVKMLGKWVEAQGFEVPADWNTVARFSDLAVDNKDQELVKYAAVVKDAGVFNGSNGALNAAGSITRENMALTLDRAYAAVFGQSLVEEAAGLENLTVSDLASAKEEAREAIQALRNLEVSNVDTFMPKNAVTRAQFASFLYRTINVEGGEQTTPPTGEVAIASVKATAVNELTVEFNQAVDTNAATFAVKRGTVEDLKISKVEWNEAGTVATVTVDHKFVDATYNLTVTGVAEEALTASVTTTKEVVSEIKFNNDKLVLTGKKAGVPYGEAIEARITFEVYNQYGERVTEKTPDSYYSRLRVKGIDTVAPSEGAEEFTFDTVNKGTIIVWVDKKEKEGETGSISFTYEFGDVEIDVDQDIVLSDDMEAGSVKFEGVHSVNGYDFTSKNVEKYGKNTVGSDNEVIIQDEFYQLLSIKDQFGNDVAAKDAGRVFSETSQDASIVSILSDGLRVSVSDRDIFDLDERYLQVINVEGKDYFAIPMEFEFNREGYVEQTGENTISIRSKATGEVNEAKVTLEASNRVYSIGLSAPNEVVASSEKVKLPVNALDQNGNVITDAAQLNRDKSGVSPKIKISGDTLTNANTSFVYEAGQMYLEFKSIVNNDDKRSEDMDVAVEIVDTDQESEITLKVQPRAYASTLVKLNDKKSTSYFTNEKFDLKLSDFVVEDQYGRVFDEVTKDYKIEIKKVSDLSTPLNLENVDAEFAVVDVVAQTTTLEKFATDDTASVEKVKFANGNIKGTSTFEFKLISRDNSNVEDDNGVKGKLVTSTITTTFRTIDETGFDSYVVKGGTTVYGNIDGSENFIKNGNEINDYAELKVYGLSGNREVLLSSSEYVVRAKDYLNTVDPANVVPTSNKTERAYVEMTDRGAQKLKDDKVSSFKSGVEVVINRTGEVIPYEITLTNTKPEFATLSLEDKKSASGKDITEVLTTTADLAGVGVFTDLLFDTTQISGVTAETQYGLEVEDNEFNTIQFIPSLNGTAVPVIHKFRYTISNVNAADEDAYRITNNGTANTIITGVEVGDSFDLTIKLDNALKTIKVRIVSEEDKPANQSAR